MPRTENKIVLVIRRTRLADLVARFNTVQQARFYVEHLGADFSDYLPFDTNADASAILDALQPSALVFSKLDVWPALAASAASRNVPLGMISATLAAESGRSSWLASTVLGDAYGALDAVGTIDEHDGERLMALGVRPDCITVTGDTRYDQVWARAQRADRSSGLLSPFADSRPTLVAGSTWPARPRFTG